MVKRFHGSRRFIFTGSWSATHVLLSFVGSELPRGLGTYVMIAIFIQCNQCTMFIRKNKIRIIILQPVDGATDGATRRVICPASSIYLYSAISPELKFCSEALVTTLAFSCYGETLSACHVARTAQRLVSDCLPC